MTALYRKSILISNCWQKPIRKTKKVIGYQGVSITFFLYAVYKKKATIFRSKEYFRMKNTKKLTLSALFLALGLVMPFLTMQIPEVGSMLLPMHIPVLICGFVCGPSWGLIVGFLTPLLRSVTFGMPPMMPTAVCMAFELATYGLVAGLLYGKLKKNVVNTYVSLVGAMLAGRVVWAVVALVVYTAMGSAFTFQMFLAGAFINAIPGIVLQIVAIPVLIVALRKAHLIEEE